MAPSKKQYLCENCGSDFHSGPGLASHGKARDKQGGVCSDTRPSNHTLKAPGTIECPHCAWHCTTPAGLSSHERARNSNGGVCKEGKHNKLYPRHDSAAGQALDSVTDPALNSATDPALEAAMALSELSGKGKETMQPPPAKKLPLPLFQQPPPAKKLPLPLFQQPPRRPIISGNNLALQDFGAVPPIDTGNPALQEPPGRPNSILAWIQNQCAPNIKDVPAGEEGMWMVDADGKRVLSEMTGMPRLNRSSLDYVVNDARVYHPEKLGADGKLL